MVLFLRSEGLKPETQCGTQMLVDGQRLSHISRKSMIAEDKSNESLGSSLAVKLSDAQANL